MPALCGTSPPNWKNKGKDNQKSNENWQQIVRIIKKSTFKHYKFLSNEEQKDKFTDQILEDLKLNEFESKNNSSVKTLDIFKVAYGNDCVKELNSHRNYVTSQTQGRVINWMNDYEGALPSVKQFWDCSTRKLDLDEEQNEEIARH